MLAQTKCFIKTFISNELQVLIYFNMCLVEKNMLDVNWYFTFDVFLIATFEFVLHDK